MRTKKNNNVTNLEWCTSSQNAVHGTRIDRILNTKISKGYSKSIVQLNLDGKLLNTYKTIADAARSTNVHVNSIKKKLFRYRKCVKKLYFFI